LIFFVIIRRIIIETRLGIKIGEELKENHFRLINIDIGLGQEYSNLIE